MKFTRLFTTPNTPIQDQIKWKTLPSEILDSTGGRIFYMPEVQVPDHWSQGATNILAQKFFRKAGVPSATYYNPQNNFVHPLWLSPSAPDPQCKFGSESSAKQVFHRLAGAWTYWGWKEGTFQIRRDKYEATNEENAQIFYDEIYWMLAYQFAAPNSPQFFNTGLNWAYGITGDKSGQWAVDTNGQPYETQDSYTNPQVHACYIQPITDNLVEKGGIFDLLRKEAIIFKHGSGTGTNFSNLRSKYETLSGGGKSSGMMSFLRIYDEAAGAIQSGGTTRRAAKLICVDLDHPEIEDFIDWKMKEEAKAAALYIGSKAINEFQHERVGELTPQAILDRIENGIVSEICDLGFEGEAMNTVSGQNANNSIRITDEFLKKIDLHGNWPLIARTNGKIVKILKSEELWQKICRAAWACADPGLLFHDTINLWHTCKNDGTINACNPCGEYQFLDDTACNLASLNLGKFLINGEFDIKSFTHATRIWTTILEISVYMASFPSREIARNTYLYRTLGLGYANAGGILMRLGLSYDSDKGRNTISAITALMHGQSCHTSQELNNELGSFERWKDNELSMSDVINRHKYNLKVTLGFDKDIWITAGRIWNQIDPSRGFRNAQITVIAPTGTIALLMDCDTTGIEPDFSLVKYKHLSGGGMMKIVNECVPEALKVLGYTPAQIMSITQHIKDHDTIEGWTVNGQPMPEEHLKVFDCAVPGGNGHRSLPPIAHVKMVAAVQPFLSGAVSKTVNMPNSATIADVDHIYREAHRLGLKAIAIYRDGSKLTQPLNTGQKKPSNRELAEEAAKELNEIINTELPPRSGGRVPDMGPSILKNKLTENFLVEEIPTTPHSDPKHNHTFTSNEVKEIITEEVKALHKSFEDLLNKEPDARLLRSKRERLPPRTTGYRQKYSVDGQSIYLHTGEYLDGRLGEIFVEFSREGSLVRALTNSIGKAVSIGLQYGVPLNEFVDAFVFTKFEPSGIVHGHDRIKLCTSPLDLIFKDLAIYYLDMEEFANTTSIQHEAERAVKSMKERKNENIDEWATNLAKDFVAAGEIEREVMLNPIPPRSEGRVPEPELNLEQFILDVEGLDLDSCIDNTVITSGIETFDAPEPDSTITQDSIIFRGLKTSIEEINYSKPLTILRLKHGDSCTACGHYPTIRSGTCITCPNCGSNTGCG